MRCTRPERGYGAWPIAARWGCCALLTAGLLLGGCGDAPNSSVLDILETQLQSLKTTDGEDQDKIVAMIADIGRREPAVVVPRLVKALSEERLDAHHNYIRMHFDLKQVAEAKQSETLAQLAAVVSQRLEANGYPGSSLRVESRDQSVLISMARPVDAAGQHLEPAAEDAFLKQAAWRLSQAGTVGLMLHVPSPAESGEGTPLWPGDETSFRALLEREHELLARAQREGRPYVPGQPPFQAALLRPTSPGQPPTAVLLRESEREGLRFGRRDLDLQVGVESKSGDQVLALRLNPQRHADLESFTRAHPNRGLALVVNGGAELIIRISKPLREEVRFPLGNTSNPADVAWAEGILRLTAGGAYGYAVRVQVIPSTPEVLSTPVARALVEIGAPAVAPMQALVREGGPLRERASWIVAEVVKQASGQRERPRTP